MARVEQFEVKGLRELSANLAWYTARIQTQIVRKALASALMVARRFIQRATYTTVQRRSGLLRAGLAVRGIRAPQGPGIVAAGVFAAKAGKAFQDKQRAAGTVRVYKRKTRRKGTSSPGVTEVFEPFYWRFIEFGTRRMRARPYIAGAFQSSALNVLTVFRRKLASELEKAAPGRPHK